MPRSPDARTAIRGLLASEGLTITRLAVRSGRSAQRLRELLLDGGGRLDDEESAHLLACFGVSPDLRPLDTDFLDERERSREWSHTDRFLAAANLCRFSTMLYEEGHRHRVAASE